MIMTTLNNLYTIDTHTHTRTHYTHMYYRKRETERRKHMDTIIIYLLEIII